ncbi:MAG: AEC family transporter [Clostridiales Family XIII bacterium]|nr:AEC family transporter [Clostridiales Family XIII bacterium]
MDYAGIENTAALFAIIVLAGFAAGKCRLLSKQAQDGLTNLILFVTLPCTIVNSFHIDLAPTLLPRFGLTLLVATGAQALAQLVSALAFKRQPGERKSVLRYGLIVCSSAFFGLPVLATLLGPAALALGAIYLIPQRFAMWSLGIAAFTQEKQRGALAKTLVHPNMIAVYIGLLLLLLHVTLPGWVQAPITSVGGCTAPLSFLVIGSILSDLDPRMLKDRALIPFCALRLVAIPGVVFLVCALLRLPPEITEIATLMAGMPAGTTTGLLALRYGADERFGSTLTILSTILFFAMMPVWMSLFSLL